MPLKGEAKKAWSKRYRKQSIKSGYGKWLYARRKARFEDAESHQAALLEIASCDRLDKARAIARASLASSLARHEAIGPSPYSSRLDPEMHPDKELLEPDSLAASLKRIGL